LGKKLRPEDGVCQAKNTGLNQYDLAAAVAGQENAHSPESPELQSIYFASA